MAKYCIALLIALAFSATNGLYAQNKVPTAKDTANLIIGKWKITQMESKGQKMNMPANEINYMQFHANGTATLSEMGRLHTEHWRYDSKRKSIIVDRVMPIVKIDKEALVLLTGDDPETITVYMQNYKP